MFRICCFLLLIVETFCAQRLPTSVTPIHYKLQILTHLDGPRQFEFDGRTWIQVNCHETTNNVTLHVKDLNITKEEVKITTFSDSDDVKIKSVALEPGLEFLVLSLEQPLQKGSKYLIYIPYVGVLEDGLKGFYRSSYVDSKTKGKKWVAVTQFQPTDARRAFPCFDEPGMKATFEISLGRKEGLVSISNMPLKQTEAIPETPGFYWDHFQKSVPMSTYLVAFFISDFGSVVSKPITRNNVTFKIWARESALDQVEFAANVGPKALEYFESYFNIPFPLPKQDMVAVPDFSAGAMENWGLITYRESVLLFDPTVSSLKSQERIAAVIAHELAHQWFGNLVTPKWWSDLWLNEGFATFMGTQAVEALFPDWKHLDEQTASNLLVVFTYDALRSSHPISTQIKNPNNIDEIFDPISYKKGAFLLRMMSLFLGQETLRLGVSNYLRQYAYKNAEQDNLWQALTDEAHKTGALPSNLTVKTVMDSWTLQTGYPLLTVQRNYEAGTAQVAQQRYIKDAVRLRDDGGSWWLPISYTTGLERNFEDAAPKLWLPQDEASTVIKNLSSADTWVLFNVKSAALFKVNYDEKNWRLLTKELKGPNHTIFPVINKVQLIDDAFDLSWTGQVKYQILFDLLLYLEQEDKYLPWKAALVNIDSLKRLLVKTSSYGFFKAYMRELIEPMFGKLGGLNPPKNKDFDAVTFQVSVSSSACRFEVPGCVSEALKLFNSYQKDPSNKTIIPNDLRDVIYCTAIKNGGESEWDFLWEQYKKANVASEKHTILTSLGCTKEIWLLRRYLEWSVQADSGIRKQDSYAVFDSVVSNNVGFYIAKNFFYSNIKGIYTSLGASAVKISRLLSPLGRHINTDFDLQELETFVKDNQQYLEQSKQGVDQALENARLNVQWQQRHYKDIDRILQENLNKH